MARDLSVTYRGASRPALEGVSFEVGPGSLLLVVGPSGSGKSTVALAVAGLLPREIPATMTGRLELDGTDVRAVDPTRLAARVGSVWQDPDAQLVMERVEDEVAFGLENRGWPLDAMRGRVPETLAEVGLAGFERRRSRRLSGGEQQRLALAGALAPRPDVLVLDEPTANLDPARAAAFMARLADIRASGRTTTVLIEHLVDAAWPLADVVLALGPDGRPIDWGPPAEVGVRSLDAMLDAGIWLPQALAGVGPVGRRRPAPAEDRRGSPVVEAADLSFAFERGQPVVRDATVAVRDGERVGLTGPNGSGKSTLARLLVGLLRPDAGTVRLLGGDPARMPARELARRAAYVFQDPERQFLTQRVADEVRLGLGPDELRRVDELMDRLRLPLDRFADRDPYRLSGGEQRRLSLACALVREPAVLVLDEPTFGQDRLGYAGLLSILEERLARGAALVAATHDRRFVADATDRTVEMAAGRIVADGPTGASLPSATPA